MQAVRIGRGQIRSDDQTFLSLMNSIMAPWLATLMPAASCSICCSFSFNCTVHMAMMARPYKEAIDSNASDGVSTPCHQRSGNDETLYLGERALKLELLE